MWGLRSLSLRPSPPTCVTLGASAASAKTGQKAVPLFHSPHSLGALLPHLPFQFFIFFHYYYYYYFLATEEERAEALMKIAVIMPCSLF